MQLVRVQHVVPPIRGERRAEVEISPNASSVKILPIERMEQMAQGVCRCANTVRVQQSRDDSSEGANEETQRAKSRSKFSGFGNKARAQLVLRLGGIRDSDCCRRCEYR